MRRARCGRADSRHARISYVGPTRIRQMHREMHAREPAAAGSIPTHPMDIEDARSRSHKLAEVQPELGLGRQESTHSWTRTRTRTSPYETNLYGGGGAWCRYATVELPRLARQGGVATAVSTSARSMGFDLFGATTGQNRTAQSDALCHEQLP